MQPSKTSEQNCVGIRTKFEILKNVLMKKSKILIPIMISFASTTGSMKKMKIQNIDVMHKL